MFLRLMTTLSFMATILMVIEHPTDTSASTPSAPMEQSDQTTIQQNGTCPYWSPNFQPLNIQVAGCCSSDNRKSTKDLDHLLNVTETILYLIQNLEQSSETDREPAPMNVGGNPRDCAEIQASGVNVSGVYSIYPDGPGDPFFVYCDMETDGGGWTVFQRRQDGSVDFYLNWCDYKYGFGSVSSEHWLGNDKIHRLTAQKSYELRVVLEDFNQQTRYAAYTNFGIGNEASNYVLNIGTYSGNAGDSLTLHNNHRFSTKDRDNDDYSSNCATRFKGAWWYVSCHYSNLNGLYLAGTTTQYATGVVWQHWLGFYYSLQKSEMKIRPM